ncbi:MAG: phosphotransferase [Desulfobacteraceae bacterium]
MEKKSLHNHHANALGAEIREFIGAHFAEIGLPSEECTARRIPGDGSKRRFWRVTAARSGTTWIAMENAPADEFSRRENLAYLMIGKHLFEKGLPLPEIYRFDLGRGWFIIEDMGDTSLQDVASLEKDRMGLYEKIVEILFRLQIDGSKGFDTAWTCQTETYDYMVMRHYESDYFTDAFLHNYLGLKRDWPELENSFSRLAEMAARPEGHFFLHRDFQSRNIMISGDRIGILDWQGGRLGPLGYDLAALIIDPYTNLSAWERDRIYQAYLQMVMDYEPSWIESFQRYFPYLAIQRNLQILGAFAFLSKVRRKAYFEAYIPSALESLTGLIDTLNDRKLSPLADLVKTLPDMA